MVDVLIPFTPDEIQEIQACADEHGVSTDQLMHDAVVEALFR